VPICLIDFLLACITRIACWWGPDAEHRVRRGTALENAADRAPPLPQAGGDRGLRLPGTIAEADLEKWQAISHAGRHFRQRIQISLLLWKRAADVKSTF
jgi:hypothetical protein